MDMGWDWPKDDRPARVPNHRGNNNGKVELSCDQAAVAYAGTLLLFGFVVIALVAKGIRK